MSSSESKRLPTKIAICSEALLALIEKWTCKTSTRQAYDQQVKNAQQNRAQLKTPPRRIIHRGGKKSLNQESTGKNTFTERNEQERVKQESSTPAQGTKPTISRGGTHLATQPKTTRINKHLSVITYYRLPQITNKEMQTY